MKTFKVTIELDTVELFVKANNKSHAKAKALIKLNKKKPSSMIRKSWPANRKEIDVESE